MRADILVVGGGLAGTAISYHLARGGADVLLIERAEINALASGANSGSIHAQIPLEPFLEHGENWTRGFAPVVPLLIASIGLWSGLEAELDADLEVALPGGLMVAEDERQLRLLERKAAVERAHGLSVDILSAADLRRTAPYLATDLAGAAFCAIEGKANPQKVAPAFARAAERLGARMACGVELQGLRAEADGFVAATNRGPITARLVVDCAGAEAGAVAAMVGVDLPLQGFPIQVNVTEPVAPVVSHLVYSAGRRLTLKQARSGALLIGGGWPAKLDPATGQPVVDPDSVRDNLRAAIRTVPTLRHAQLLRSWPAIVNGTDDWRPILGEVRKVPGFWLSLFPWLGFSGGLIAARTVAATILGSRPEVDIQAFAPSG
jgi:glycine/D-amino acid oxidase-like deaminating enzyme